MDALLLIGGEGTAVLAVHRQSGEPVLVQIGVDGIPGAVDAESDLALTLLYLQINGGEYLLGGAGELVEQICLGLKGSVPTGKNGGNLSLRDIGQGQSVRVFPQGQTAAVARLFIARELLVAEYIADAQQAVGDGSGTVVDAPHPALGKAQML